MNTYPDGTPKLRGISYVKNTGRYRVQVCAGAMVRYVGCALTIEDAFQLYLKAVGRTAAQGPLDIRVRTLQNIIYNYSTLLEWRLGDEWAGLLNPTEKIRLNQMKELLRSAEKPKRGWEGPLQ